VKNSFYLLIPTQKQQPRRLKEFEAKLLQQWLDELPTANLSLATRLLHDFVVELNTLEMPSQLRVDVLERIRQHVINVEDYLQSRLLHTGFPKDDNEKKIFEILISIQKECAIGYWIVLKEITHRDAGWLKAKNTALAIQRCIEKLGRIVTNYFIMRSTVAGWVWIDLHSLYKLSVMTKRHTEKVPLPNQPSKAYSPEDSYKQVLLLHLSDPTGLMQKEIPQVHEFCSSITELLQFKRAPTSHQPIQCTIFPDEDLPPQFGNRNIKEDTAAFFLDFSGITKHLIQQEKQRNKPDTGLLNLFGKGKLTCPLSTELLTYLQQRWFGTELQSATLFADRLDCVITIGLSATHDIKSTVDEKEAKNMVLDPKDKTHVVAHSASDQLLSAVFRHANALSVGSLISFRKKYDTESSRCLGIVNKVSMIGQDGKITFGIELITNRFYPALCHPKSKSNNVQKGIFYATKELLTDKKFIITDYSVKEGESIYLTIAGESFPITIESRKNIGLGYWQFECKYLLESTKPATSNAGYDFI
jgi:cyclic-di-GMP-binding protein